MLVDDLAKVVQGFLRIVIATRRIADRAVNGSASSIGGISDSYIADGVKREIDIARAQAARGRNLRRIGLIEYIEEAGPELNLFRFADVEVLEERDVEIAPVRSPYIERRLRGSSIWERRNLERAEIVYLLPDSSPTAGRRRIAEINRRDRAYAGARIGAIECIGAVPCERCAR